MIAFRCPHCDRDLKVKDELTGKKVRCSGCGNAVSVPESAAAGSRVKPGLSRPADDVTLPPRAAEGAEERTRPPAKQAAHDSLPDSDEQTDLGGNKGEATQAYATNESHDELTDFLAPAQAADELGRLGGFRILKVLGHGGMGVVFQGEDPKLGRKVAIKAMLPHLAGSKSSQERFLREAKAAAALEHDHIVPILQIGEDRGAPFIVMPFLQGEPLDARLRRDKTLPISEVLRIGRETAEGLAAAHQRGLIHRDIKPANLWLEGNDERGMMNDERKKPGDSRSSFITHHSSFRRVKILDFGLARAGGETGLTQTGAIIGTPQYMAPEQAAGRKNIDHRCDLFSLGCVLYRMCTGELPFKGDDTLAIISALAMDTPEPPVILNLHMPTELSDLVMQLLAKKPEDRPQSAQAVVEAIRELESFSEEPKATGPSTRRMKPSGTTRTEAAATVLTPAAKKRMPKSWLVGGGILAVALLGSVVFFITSQDRKGPKTGKVGVKGEKGTATFTNSIGMEFVLVPKGKSWLGGGGGKPGDKEVEVVHDFYLGKYEVTQEEWVKVMGNNPSYFSRTGGGKDQVKDISDAELRRFPLEQVSWYVCQEFIKQLNQTTKENGWEYRLPKADEWEYACRGGQTTVRSESSFSFYLEIPTNELTPEFANCARKPNRPRRVGFYKPNRLGLYDMHGNVEEWCDDRVTDILRFMLGGNYGSDPNPCSATIRHATHAQNAPASTGLRVARVPIGKEIVKTIAPEDKKPATQSSTFKNTLGMEFVLVPKGKSWLGGGGGRPGDKEVEILHDFYLGKYEVTQEEWEKVTGLNPSAFKAMAGVDPEDQKRFPIESVTWDQAQEFVKLVNEKSKETGWVYRLPKEQEWEYACRGGPLTERSESARDFYLETATDLPLPGQANFREGPNPVGRPCKVGSYRPNRLGLYDMHGNVIEWCDDGDRGAGGALRPVSRGGAWSDDRSLCRASYRVCRPPQDRHDHLGLRLARVPVGKEIVRTITSEKSPEDPERRAANMLNPFASLTLVLKDGKAVEIGRGLPLPESPFKLGYVFIPFDTPLPADFVSRILIPAVVQVTECLGIGSPEPVLKIPEADLERLVSSPSGKTLSTLILDLPVSARTFELLGRLPALTSLGLRIDKADSKSLKQLATLRALTGLTLAGESGLQGTREHSSALSELKLKSFGLIGLKGIDSAFLQTLQEIQGLEELQLYRVNLRDEQAIELARLSQLRSLRLERNQLTDKSFGPMSKLQKLERLGLGGNRVTKDSVLKLAAALPHCKIEWDGGVVGPTLPSEFKNALGMEFVIIPKGKSWLGGGGGKPGDKEVDVLHDFYLGKYEVTQAEWRKVMGSHPSLHSRTGALKDKLTTVDDAELDRFPVENVSWEDAQQFLEKLNLRDKVAGWVYRLPKEAEWEYACRGGPMSDPRDSAFDFYFDKPARQLPPDQANFEHGKGLKRTCKVGKYQPNKLGLYDMHGNVWEWCDDEMKDAKGVSYRVDRGGSWFYDAEHCRAAKSVPNPASHRFQDLGLRVARVPAGKVIVKGQAP